MSLIHGKGGFLFSFWVWGVVWSEITLAVYKGLGALFLFVCPCHPYVIHAHCLVTALAYPHYFYCSSPSFLHRLYNYHNNHRYNHRYTYHNKYYILQRTTNAKCRPNLSNTSITLTRSPPTTSVSKMFSPTKKPSSLAIVPAPRHFPPVRPALSTGGRKCRRPR